MKKFNMFALIALSLAVVGNVHATQGGTLFGTFPTSFPTQITNQKGALAAARLAARPSGNNLMSRAMSAGTPASALAVSAMGGLTANTKAGTKANFDSPAFQQGAQVTNEQTSAVAGGMNQMGQNVAASSSVTAAGLTGANLKNIAAATTAPTTTSAMSTLTSNTKNSGTVRFSNSSQPRPGAPSSANADGSAGEPGVAPLTTGLAPVAGTFGNVTSKIGLTTQGSSNMVGGSTGSSHMLNLSGNFGSNS
jgi:hypothetical protein